MERFKVGGEELRQHYPNGTTLSRVFSDIERELKQESRVVCQFIVNGLALEEKDEARFSKLDLGEVQTLEYLSQGQGQIVGEVLNSWLDALPELMRNGEKLALRLKDGKIEGRLKDFHDLVENCEFLIGSLISLRGLLGDGGTAKLVEWERIEILTRTTVAQILAAFEKQDLVQLSELIEYDLNHSLECWRLMLIELQTVWNGAGTESGKGDAQKTAADPVGRGTGSC